MSRAVIATILVVALTSTWADAEEQAALRKQAMAAMKKAVGYFTSQVATQGGYLWEYSLDLKKRAGEGKATPTQIWVQPPGTPSVGEAMLAAYKATQEPVFLEAAVDAAHALAWGQLASGGWDYRIDFHPKACKRWYYRRDVEAGDTDSGKRRNVSTFDDDNSQSALRLLMHVDQVLDGKDAKIRKAVEYALKHFLAAQYPNGAWPQRYWKPHDPAKHPVKKARYPESWSREYPGASYLGFYTWNDNAIWDCARTMRLAHRIYGKPEYQASVVKAGDFAILSQMPDPQPAWAQQYNFEMEPAWARKFEPPSVTAGESKAALRVLRLAYEVTGNVKYLAPIPKALGWYKRSKLPGGYWARFYELKTNKPLYFTRKTYKLTYDDGDMPQHYCFKSKGMYPTQIEAWYDALMKQPADRRAAWARERATPRTSSRSKVNAGAVRKVIDALDDQGRWRDGDQIRTSTFIQNMRVLAQFVQR